MTAAKLPLTSSATCLHTNTGGIIAIDAYLEIEGIKGESTDDKHKDWIEVAHVVWAVHRPRPATVFTVSTAGGHTTGYAGKAVKALGLRVDPALLTAGLVTIVACAVWLELRGMHKRMHRRAHA